MSIGSVVVGAIALTSFTSLDVVKPTMPSWVALPQKPQVTLSSSSELKQLSTVASAARYARLTAQYSDSAINIRSAPSTNAEILNVGYVGDTAEVLGERYSDDDGFVWYNLRLATDNTQGWVRQDLVSLFSPGEADKDRAIVSTETTVSSTTQDSSAYVAYASPQPTTPGAYSSAAVDYFLEVAMGSEYGDAVPNVRKWEGDLRIKIMTPNATPQDRATVDQVIAELNQLLREAAGETGTPVTLRLVDQDPNVEMYFVPAEDFARYNSNAQEGQVGCAWMEVNNNVIHGAEILIASNYLTDAERAHVIREELTQSLGIMKDSWLYPDSIFYQGWTRTNQYTELDREVIRMLYDSSLDAGMSQQQVARTLQR